MTDCDGCICCYRDLSFNYLNGSIPSSWASLPLIHLSLVGNRISGRIPPDLGKIITLQNLTLDQNQLQGPIPSSLGNLKNLNLLHLRANNLSGELPESLGNLTNLTEFLIDGNPITGKIPSFIGNWTMLRKLYMQGTSMEGLLPAVLSNLSNIIELVVSDLAGGDGKFPPLKNMFVIKYLVLRNLSISGELPDYIGQMELKRLDLSFNNLTGPIPSSYEALQSSIDYLYLTNNMLNGTIPSWILTSRKNMDLSYNNFTGLPAPSDCHQPNVNLVSSYSMTNNASITSCLRKNYPCPGKAKNYNVFINCGGNSVTVGTDDYGEDTITAPLFQSSDSKWAASTTGYFVGNERAEYIAKNSSLLAMENAQLYMTARLSPLSLRYYGLCLQKGTYTIRLHFAEIVFTDDNTYASVGRRLFDVSIQGRKVLMDFDIAKKANGTGKEVVESFNATVDETLEIHFQWEGKGTQSIPYPGSYGPLISAISVTPNFKPEIGTKKLYVGILVGIVVGCVVALLVVFVVVCLCLRRKTAADNELRGLELQGSSFSLKQIKEATENFSSVNKIGEGGFGPVYKGVLRDGSVIAVKQLSSKSKQGDREFINEIGMISALNHPNLVKLFGCCIEGNQLLLIYEYMENNSLARALFGPERYHLNLNWQTRRNICIGVAQGLAYLHEESRLKIVHRDIKATNILLDESLNVKISDFGLAKLDEQENTHISTRIAGTVGYMAPEYAMRGYLTDKADVYSFGVVVLEVVSGMSNTSYRPKEDCVYLLDLAYVLQEQGNLIELVDPNLSANYSKEEALQMLNISLICTNPSPTLRPTMSSVVSMLEGRMAAKIPSIQCGASRHREDLRFKSLERHSVSTSVASTPSVSLAFSQNSQEEKHPAISATSRLLPEHIE